MKPRRYKQWAVQYRHKSIKVWSQWGYRHKSIKVWSQWGQIPGDQFSSEAQAAKCYDFKVRRFTSNRWRIVERTIVERVVR